MAKPLVSLRALILIPPARLPAASLFALGRAPDPTVSMALMMAPALVVLLLLLPAPHAAGQAVFDYTAEEIIVATEDGLELGGTLLIPTTARGVAAPGFPAAVLVHGSGPNDRDEALQLPDAATGSILRAEPLTATHLLCLRI